MGYNVVDLIDKAIVIAGRRKTIFENIGQEKSDIPSLKIISKVLSKQVDKTIQYYETLKREVANEEIEEIDFVIYDKMSFLINEFNKKIYAPQINDVKEYLKFTLGLQKDTYSLLVDIQGRFVKNTSDVHSKTYKILGDIIDNISMHIDTIEKNLK